MIATGLNQRHIRALAEAVAWQLQQVAQQTWQQQQQQQQQGHQQGHQQQLGQEEDLQVPTQHLHQQNVDLQQQQQQQQQPTSSQQQADQAANLQLQALVDVLAQQESRHGQKQQQEQEEQPEVQGQVTEGKQQAPKDLLPPLNVVGDASSDWCLLDAGSVTVHVLTQRARRFYALEALWGGERGRYIQWLRADQPRLETKDTIGRPAFVTT